MIDLQVVGSMWKLIEQSLEGASHRMAVGAGGDKDMHGQNGASRCERTCATVE